MPIKRETLSRLLPRACRRLTAWLALLAAAPLPLAGTPEPAEPQEALAEAPLTPEAPGPLDPRKTRVAENPHFLIAGESLAGVTTLNRLSREMTAIAAATFNIPPRFARPVVVQLMPPEAMPGGPPYLISSGPRGGVTIAITWNSETSFEITCEALARGFLRQLGATWKPLPERTGYDPPDWLELGFSLLLEARLRGHLPDYFARLARQRSPRPLADIVGARGPYGTQARDLALDAYWLLRFLRREAGNRRTYQRMLTETMLGKDGYVAILEHYRGHFSDRASLELWWAVGFNDLVRGRQRLVSSPAESRLTVQRLAELTPSWDGITRRVDLAALTHLREREEVREALRQRRLDANLALPQINPVYRNALISLIEAYEAYPLGEEPFNTARQRFTEDLHAATQLHQAIDSLLGPPTP